LIALREQDSSAVHHVPSQPVQRRGVTMLETVLATVLVAMIATTLVSGLGYAHASHERQENQLGAAEVANRVMLQYLDDKKTLPSSSLAIAYGKGRYYWRVEEQKIELRVGNRGLASESSRTGGLRLDRLQLITVSVWSEQQPNVNPAITGAPHDFSLARIMDPVAIRNPDSIMRTISDEEGVANFLNRFSTFQQGGGE
jgi:hypothetical protein